MDYVYDVSERQQTPLDFIAVSALCALAAVIGNGVRGAPKQHDDWIVVPNLWGALIGQSSTYKTPAMKAALLKRKLTYPMMVIAGCMMRLVSMVMQECMKMQKYAIFLKSVVKFMAMLRSMEKLLSLNMLKFMTMLLSMAMLMFMAMFMGMLM